WSGYDSTVFDTLSLREYACNCPFREHLAGSSSVSTHEYFLALEKGSDAGPDSICKFWGNGFANNSAYSVRPEEPGRGQFWSSLRSRFFVILVQNHGTWSDGCSVGNNYLAGD